MSGVLLEDWTAGFEHGYASGQEDGFRQGERAEATLWSSAFGGLITEAMRGPRHKELVAARATLPEDTSCTCAPCSLRRDAVRRNGGDYLGGGRAA